MKPVPPVRKMRSFGEGERILVCGGMVLTWWCCFVVDC